MPTCLLRAECKQSGGGERKRKRTEKKKDFTKHWNEQKAVVRYHSTHGSK